MKTIRSLMKSLDSFDFCHPISEGNTSSTPQTPFFRRCVWIPKHNQPIFPKDCTKCHCKRQQLEIFDFLTTLRSFDALFQKTADVFSKKSIGYCVQLLFSYKIDRKVYQKE